MKLWAYVIVWNEELMLPFFLRHYSQFCDKIIIYDNMSTDGSREIIETFKEKVEIEVVPFETNGKFNDYVHIELKKRSIQHAKGSADFIILADCDEFIFHNDLRGFLSQHTDHSVFFPAGFQMVSDGFPNPIEFPNLLHQYVGYGEPNPWYVKPSIVNINLINDLEWVEGAHELDPNIDLGKYYHPIPESIRPLGEYKGHIWGRWKMLHERLDTFNDEPLKLLHFKFLGFDYVNYRYSQYVNKMSDLNHEKNVGMQYEVSLRDNSIQSQIDEIKSRSIKVNLD